MKSQGTSIDDTAGSAECEGSVSINRDEYIRLASSRRKFYRWDSEDRSVRGLLDRASGMRYVIPERDLIGEDGEEAYPWR